MLKTRWRQSHLVSVEAALTLASRSPELLLCLTSAQLQNRTRIDPLWPELPVLALLNLSVLAADAWAFLHVELTLQCVRVSPTLLRVLLLSLLVALLCMLLAATSLAMCLVTCLVTREVNLPSSEFLYCLGSKGTPRSFVPGRNGCAASEWQEVPSQRFGIC